MIVLTKEDTKKVQCGKVKQPKNIDDVESKDMDERLLLSILLASSAHIFQEKKIVVGA